MDEYETIAHRSRHPCLVGQALEARPYVEQLCGLYNVKLVSILHTPENDGPLEPVYVFDNDLGGYTLDGVLNSIKFAAVDGGRKE